MNWKKWMSAILAIIIALSTVTPVLPATASAAGETVYTVSAPEKDLKIQFWLDDAGSPWYKVVSNGKELIEASQLGLATSLGQLNSGLSLVGTPATASGDAAWEPVVGEHAQIRDRWNESAFTLKTSGGQAFGIVMRAYDEGVAFRYVLPEVPDGSDSYTVSDEYTQFVFQAGAKASLHCSGNQTVPREYAVESLPSSTVQRPATVEFSDGQVLTICEANLSNYSVMTMAKSGVARALEANLFGSVIVDGEGPAASPWRVLVIGKEPTDLLENHVIIQNLNEPADEETYKFSEWVDPGTCVRATTGMNTNAIKGVIDIASEHGIRYVLLDSGWYGPEYDPNADPRLDPAALDPQNEKDQILLEKYFASSGGYNNTGEGVFNTNGVGFNQYGSLGDGGSMQVNVDIPALCAYGKNKNVGIILYVNKVFLPDSSKDAQGNLRNRFTVDELFAYYEKWGVAGVKPGFVNVRTQQYETYMEEVIEAAAKHKLVMTIHDEYVTTGQERTFPNMMMTEGILGDESIGRDSPQVAEDITTIFTRNIQGPPDHTFCYPGKATKAYALASPIMFRSGMSVIYWYTNPSAVPAQDKGKLAIWDNMPTNWDESLFLEGSLYEYATTARKAAGTDTWYVGSLSAITRTLELPLDFLDENVTYVADIYADGVDADPYAGWTTSTTAAKSKQTLEIKKLLVTSETVLQRDLNYGFGYAVVLTPATQEEIASLDMYNVHREKLEQELARSADITAADYTQESFAAFETAFAAAEAVLADGNASDVQLQNACNALQEARLALVATAALEAAIADTAYYTSYHYTETSFQALMDAVAAAQNLLDSGNFTQKQLDDAYAAITAAVEGLQEDPDRVLKKTVYLDELNYDTTRSIAHANAIKKKTDYYGGTLSLMVDGKEQIFERGLMTHAQADVYYNIEGMDLQIFEAYVGIDTVKPSQGNVIFRVYGDGKLLYESAASGNGSQNAQRFTIPIAGVKELHLEANMVGSNDGDHAVWGDAKFLVYRDPNAYLNGMTVDGKEIPHFDQKQTEYFVYVPDASRIPVVDAVVAEPDVSYSVEAAQTIPGCAKVTVNKRNGETVTYWVYLLQAEASDYLSDLGNLVTKNTLYGFTKDKAQGGLDLALTAADGTSAIYFDKGVGTHATVNGDSMVVYNIEGRDYDRFTGYVGISYLKNDNRSSINFKIYVDDETTPRFESGRMNYRTPAIAYDVDVRGAKKLTLVADPCGDQSADHGCWCDAKFLKYTGVQQVSGTVDVNNTGLEKAGIAVGLHEIVNGEIQKQPVKTVLTDENGAYCFANVLVGEYAVQIPKGDNHLAVTAQIRVEDADVTQNLTLQAPEYRIEILQSADAIVLTDRTVAVRNDEIAVYVRDITPGKLLEEVWVTAEDGTAVSVTASEEEYTFLMPAQNVTVQVTFTDDDNYADDLAAARAVDEKILAVGEVTLDKKAQIENIRAEYEALSETAKTYVEELALLEHYEYLLQNMDTAQAAEAAKDAAEAAKVAAEEAQAAAEAAKAAAEEAAASTAEDTAAAEAAKAAAENAQKLAEAAKVAAEEAQAAAESANAEAAKEAQAAAEAASAAAAASATAAEAAKEAQAAATAAEAAQSAAEEAAVSAAEDKAAAEIAKSAAESAQTQAAAAKAAAETAKVAADTAAAAAEASNVKAAEEAAKAAESASESAASASAAAGSAADAAAAAQNAQAAQAAAEEAQTAAEEAAASAAEDKTAAEAARAAAEAAQTQAETAKAAAETAKAAADAAAAAAEESNLEAAQEAALSAASAAESASAAKAAADSAKTAAEAAQAAQAAQAAAEEAAAKTAADKAAVEKAREEAEKAAAQASLSIVKYNALVELNEHADSLKEGATPESMARLSEAAKAAREKINNAEDAEAVAEALKEGKESLDEAACLARAFDDVDLEAWYHAAIDYVLQEGIMNGNGDGTFAPEKALTRAMLVQILYNIENRPAVETEKTFDDVEQNAWYYNAVMWAAENGIVKGYDNGAFGAEDNVTREQMVTILWRYAGEPECTAQEIVFADSDNISQWAKDAVMWAYEAGIVQGVGNDMFDPAGNSIRAAAAQIMMNYYK